MCLPILKYNWFPRGHQHKIKTYGKHEGAKLFGTLDYETGKVFYQESGSYDAQAFKQFLKSLLKEYHTGKVVVVLDNGRIHKAASIAQFVQDEPRLGFVFLPNTLLILIH